MLEFSMNIVTHPVAIPEADFLGLQEAFTMSFGYGYPLHYEHAYKKGETTFTVIYDGDLTDKIPDEMRSKLQRVETTKNPVYFYRATISDDGITEVKNATTAEEIRGRIENHREWYQSIQPRSATEVTATAEPPTSTIESPASITIPDIAARLISKRYLFFTGAGLSANVVPEWDGMKRLMGYNPKRNPLEQLSDTLEFIQSNLSALMQGLHDAHHAFIHGTPSAGHQAIASICHLTNRVALTDNRDIIQQASGIHAVHVNQLMPFTDTPWQPSMDCNAEDIDGIIVCGMGGDRRGFLQWLKTNHPETEIIHMDLAPSDHLPTDRFIQGDLQTLLPQLQREVTTISERNKRIAGSRIRL